MLLLETLSTWFLVPGAIRKDSWSLASEPISVNEPGITKVRKLLFPARRSSETTWLTVVCVPSQR